MTLGHARGIPIRAHWSLVLILPLLAAAFTGRFRTLEADLLLPPFAWGLVVATGLLASVLVHELAHSLIAVRVGGRVRSITLFFMGGVSELASDLPRPRQEAVVAGVGPLASLAIAGLLYLANVALAGRAPADVEAALVLLAVLNAVLGVFNLLPAFPLDGGRILRALLTARLGRPRATRVASRVGKAMATGLGVLGLQQMDVMLALVAGFVFLGAERETQGVSLDERLRSVRVSAAMDREPLILSTSLTVSAAAARMLASRVDVAAVASPREGVRGAVTSRDLARVAAEARGILTLGDLVKTTEGLPPTETLADARARLVQSEAVALPVVDQSKGRLLGVLSLRDVERELALREVAERTSWWERAVSAER